MLYKYPLTPLSTLACCGISCHSFSSPITHSCASCWLIRPIAPAPESFSPPSLVCCPDLPKKKKKKRRGKNKKNKDVLLQLRCIFISSNVQLPLAVSLTGSISLSLSPRCMHKYCTWKIGNNWWMPSKNAAATTADFHLYTCPAFYAHFPRRHCERSERKSVHFIGVGRRMFLHSSGINKSMHGKSATCILAVVVEIQVSYKTTFSIK